MAYDDYDLLEKIAMGARTTVYRATDKRSGLTVAIKKLGDESGYQEWEREVFALETIKSPNVVTLHESGRFRRGGYLALEWLGGLTLEAKVLNQPLTLGELSLLASCALQALHDIHWQQFLHRDVSPANLKQARDGSWKLIDFGQARRLGDASEQPLVGSVHCMAPEQFEGKTLDERTDYYALACTLHFGLTGRFAHWGDTNAEVITSHLYPRPTALAEMRPDLPTAVTDWVEWLMSRHPADRPQNYWRAQERLMAACFDSCC
jgi:serine/threonine protein kinase